MAKNNLQQCRRNVYPNCRYIDGVKCQSTAATAITFDLSVKNVYMYFFRESRTSHTTTIICFLWMPWSWTTFSVHAEVIPIKSRSEINGKLGFTFSSPPSNVSSELCRGNTFYILPTIVYDIKSSVSFHNRNYGGNERRCVVPFKQF